ncbi:MAG: helix-turn-helix domain-containing protein [Candidatus Omnitrophica bacterium]|nr:helix-turn-helix domain-containing protein [Candidatus Omnitrophota bacterium]
MAKLVTAKELSISLGLSVASINYYTNLGFFEITDRSGNKRLYNKDKACSIYKKIKNLRRKGYPLKLIKKKLGS